MAEVNAKDLTTKTAPASTDSMLLFGTTTNEGAKITVDNLADNILSRLATKTFPNQVGGSSAATILAQLATLNSKTALHYQGTLNNGQTFEKNGDVSYGVFFVMGLIGGYGAVCDLVPITGGSVGTVRNLITSAVQGSNVHSYSYSRDNGLTISSTSSAFCAFDIISF